MSDYAHSASAVAARTAKAVKLEQALRDGGFTADAVEALDAKRRHEAERIAGVRTCSAETWALVVAFMRDHEGAHRG